MHNQRVGNNEEEAGVAIIRYLILTFGASYMLWVSPLSVVSADITLAMALGSMLWVMDRRGEADCSMSSPYRVLGKATRYPDDLSKLPALPGVMDLLKSQGSGSDKETKCLPRQEQT